MKELSIEEKAKAYDNIIEKANKMHSENCEACQMCIEELIPEIAESENERIRKYLLTLITSIWADTIENYGGFTKEQVIAWLEKQKLVNQNRKLVYHKFNIGDVISPNVIDKRPYVTNPDYTIVGFNETMEDYLVDGGNIPSCSIGIEFIDKNYHLKGQKPAWSEEDEIMINGITIDIEELIEQNAYDVTQLRKEIDWLRTLKDRVQPQNRWKPSDEQIKALERTLSNFSIGCTKEYELLRSLLKKLKEG